MWCFLGYFEHKNNADFEHPSRCGRKSSARNGKNRSITPIKKGGRDGTHGESTI